MFVSLFKDLNLANLPNMLLRKVLFVLLLASSSVAQALTMGDFVVDSFLDTQLKAEILVDGNSGDNLNSLNVSIASEEEFKQAGIVRSPALDSFNFQFVRQSTDQVKVLVTTEDVITEPYIHMLLKVQWNGGQLLREFTALIDPPLFSSNPADPINSAKTTAQKELELRQELNATGQQPRSTGTLSDGNYGPVQTGETLSEIALTIQKDNPDLSIYQIMYALFQNNQSAFTDNNINNLAKGATLTVGDLSATSQVSKQESLDFFYSQVAQWSANKGSTSGVASDGSNATAEDSLTADSNNESYESSTETSQESVTEDSTNEGTSSQSTTEEVAENPEFQVGGSDLQSSSQESSQINSQAVTELQSKLSDLEASVASAKIENDELKEQIALLENQLANSNRIIELNNQELAQIAAANEQEENTAVSSTTVEDTPPEDNSAEEPVQSTEEQEAIIDEQPSEESSTESTPNEVAPESEEVEQVAPEAEVSEVEEVETSEPEVEPAPAVTPATQSKSGSFLDSIIGIVKAFWKFIAIGLLGLLAVIYWKVRSSGRKEDTIDAFESTFTVYPDDTATVDIPEEPDSASDAKAEKLVNNAIKAKSTKIEDDISSPANTMEMSSETSAVSSIDMDALREATQSVSDFDAEPSEKELTKESSFLTVYNDGDVVVNADEIDPIAEADVYIAYGREDQGEEVLLDGVKNYPERNDIKIALLGLYAKSNKRSKFDEIYESLVDNGLKDNPEDLETVEGLRNQITGGNNASDNNASPKTDNSIIDEEASDTDFVASNDDDLSEIEINSESFNVSEIDFNTEVEDVPVLSDELKVDETTVELDIDAEDVALEDEISVDIKTHSDQVDSNTIEIDGNTLEIESITIEVGDSLNESPEDKKKIDDLVDNLSDVDFTADIDPTSEDISDIEEEISQIDFSDENINNDKIEAEKSIQIDISDEIDINAEISEVSYNDEVSLTDVMELNVNDVDLTSIPDDQDLTQITDNPASTLVSENDVDYFDDDNTIDNEVTIDLTETMEFANNENKLGDIDLDLGGDVEALSVVDSDGSLPDGNNDPETQLDLAKVFLELDDVPGAVKILKELVDNDQVGKEAKELLTKYS